MQEKQHAGLIQFCVYEKLFAPKVPDDNEIEKLNAFFSDLERRAAGANLTLEEAFSLAIELEASEINAIYCNLTTPLHNSTYLLRRKIATSLPHHIDELIAAARKLSRGFPFVRVDLYSIRQGVIFGEMTWCPGGGLSRFSPDSYDLELGQALKLPRTSRSFLLRVEFQHWRW